MTRPSEAAIISLTYMSSAVVPFGDDDLAELLLTCREKNHAAGLTGVMLYAGGHFIQTLEGPSDVVDATVARIQQDTRHRNLDFVLREEIATRKYPDWSMGFETMSVDDASRLPGFNDFLEGGTVSAESAGKLGRAGIFHRVFRDNMR